MPLLPLQTRDAAYAHDQLSKCEEHARTLRTQLQQVTAERDSEHHLRQQAEARAAPQHSLPQLAEHLARVQQVRTLSKLRRRFLEAAMVHWSRDAALLVHPTGPGSWLPLPSIVAVTTAGCWLQDLDEARAKLCAAGSRDQVVVAAKLEASRALRMQQVTWLGRLFPATPVAARGLMQCGSFDGCLLAWWLA